MGEFKVDPRIIQSIIGMGADLSAYGGNTDKGFQPTALNASTTQNITAQSMLKLIKQALGPDDLNIKASNKGLTINVPNPAEPEQLSGPGKEEGSAVGAAPKVEASPQFNPFAGIEGGSSNPFSNVKPADLAGLTPQDIMSVLSAKFHQDDLRQRSYRDMVKALHEGEELGMKKESHPVDMKYKEALTAEARAREAAETPSVEVNLDGYKTSLTKKDYLTYKRLEKETTPNEVKLFQFAKTPEGGGFTGSFEDFKNMDWTGHKKDYNEAVEGGYGKDFHTWMMEMAKAGATTIDLSTKVGEKRAFGDVERENLVKDPNLVSKITDHLKKDDRVWRSSTEVDKISKETGKPPEEVRTAIQRDRVFREMDRTVKSSYPDAKFIRNKGWVNSDGTVIQRDPYGK